ncbi:MAG: hypothetical protein B7O98_01350 [Zestosphaera tikiterensis]|uniref:CBS domain-containing protein n=1 Tax=Zestosphaera tikiterensis TaxID=1973259 RepID=A0A2R7Y8D7_9CREN|nr:MAG: hypothetical protein B7O98_01350 [Zestosphaera tikiterensis]
MPPRVSSYMSSPVITASKNDSLAHIRNLMIRHKIGKVVLLDEEGNVYGIISKSDFIRILYNRKRYVKPLDNILAFEIATIPVLGIQSNKSIKVAAQAMIKKNVGSLLVFDEDQKLVGIITKADLVRAYAEKYSGRYKVGDFMIKEVPTATLTHSLYYVIDLMNESGLGKVVVVEGRKPVGVITKSDVLFLNIDVAESYRKVKYVKRPGVTGRGFEGIIRVYTVPVAGDIMTPNPITVHPDEDLALAADIMVKNRIGTLPVVNNEGELIGLLTKKDVINALRQV